MKTNKTSSIDQVYVERSQRIRAVKPAKKISALKDRTGVYTGSRFAAVCAGSRN